MTASGWWGTGDSLAGNRRQMACGHRALEGVVKGCVHATLLSTHSSWRTWKQRSSG